MADYIDKVKISSSTKDVHDTGARTSIGTLSNLTTTVKTDLVSASNEINASLGDVKASFEDSSINLIGAKDTMYRCFIPRDATITMSREHSTSLNSTKFRLYMYASDGTTVLNNPYLQPADMSRTITLDFQQDVYYVKYTIYAGDDDGLQLEINSKATSFKPYVGSMPYLYDKTNTVAVQADRMEDELEGMAVAGCGDLFLFEPAFEIGSIVSGSNKDDVTNRIRTKGYIPINRADFAFVSDGYFDITVIAYLDDKTYSSVNNVDYFNGNKVKRLNCSYARLVLKRHSSASAAITDADMAHANIFMHRLNAGGSVEHVTVMTHNVGHYNYGTGTGGYTGSDFDAQLQNWRNMYGITKPDIIAMQEWYNYFDDNEQRSAEANLYKQITQFNTYNMFTSIDGRAIFSKYYLHDADTFTISGTYDGETLTRNVLCAVAEINDHQVLIVNAHLENGTVAGNTPSKPNIRLAQADDLITKIAAYGYDDVILCGDFNSTIRTSTDPETYEVQTALLEKFTTAGYTILNNGYLGAIETLNGDHGSESIDNIMIKGEGLRLSGAESNSDWACTSDHYPLVGHITIR